MKIERLSAVQTFAWGGRRLSDDVGLIVPFGVVGVLNLLTNLATGPAIAVLWIVSTLGTLIAGAMAHVGAFNAFAEPALAIDDPFERAVSKLASLIGVAVIYFLAVAVGTIFLILPGVYLALRLSLAFPACVIGDRGAAASIKESTDVAAGNLLKILGVQTIGAAFSIGVIVALLLSNGGSSMPEPATISAASLPVSAIVAPIIHLALGRIYVENATDLVLSDREDSADTDGDDEVPGTARTPANW